MDKERTVTIKLSLKPFVNEAMKQQNAIEYDRAEYLISVGSPSLPTTEIKFDCAVTNGKAYFNIENPANALQLTFRDMGDKGGGEEIPDGKAAAVKD